MVGFYFLFSLLWTISNSCPTNVMINELEYDNPGGDVNEWVELFDGGTGNTALDGLILTAYNNVVTKTQQISLDGLSTDADGFLVVTFTAGKLQNEQEAVFLICGPTAPTTLDSSTYPALDVKDGIVYEYSSSPLVESLIPSLAHNVHQADVSGSPTTVSRCNCQTRLTGVCFESIRTPTPGAANDCPISTTTQDPNQLCRTFLRVSGKVMNSPDETKVGVAESAYECSQECLRMEGCQTFEYLDDSGTHYCKLSSEHSSNSTVFADDANNPARKIFQMQ